MRLRSCLLSLVLVLVAACSSTTSGHGSNPARDLVGSYHLVGDVGGQKVKTGATVTLVLRADGTLQVVAEQAGQRLTDSGSWRLSGNTITVEFRSEQIKGSGRYEYDGRTLRLPILVFGSGNGVSEWTRVGAGPSSAPPSGAPSSGTQTPGAPVAWSDSVWDVSKDGAAAGTKAYTEALARGATRADAISQALAKAKSVPGVSSADLSANGLNITVTYSDGQTEDIVTERLQPPSSKGPSKFADLGDPATCDTLPGRSPTPQEPGREGINPGGGYGVQIYDQGVQPKPVSSADTPSNKRALLVVPQYDVMHPIGTSLTTIRQVTGNNVECLSATLHKRGYTVDTILGKISGSSRSQVGELAIADLIKDLTSNKYGVFYFIGHGYLTHEKDKFAGVLMGEVDTSRPEIQKILNGGKVNHDNFMQVEQAYASLLGLTWDANDPAITLAPDNNGTATLVLRPGFFTQMKGRGVDLSQAFVFMNGCSSAVTLEMAQAIGPKAYVGWKHEMDGSFVADAAEQILDVLTDTAKTVRFATQVWELHEKWAAPPGALDPHVDWANIAAFGEGVRPYDVLDAQTYILIFAIRNGPSSATADIRKNATFVQQCYDQVWKFHKGALASPACHALQFGNVQPTEGEVVDALSEVGLKHIGNSAGRWTLAD